jgi:uncharacterized protein YjaZ
MFRGTLRNAKAEGMGRSRVGMWADISDHPRCNYFYGYGPSAVRHQNIKRGAGKLSMAEWIVASGLSHVAIFQNPRADYTITWRSLNMAKRCELVP